MAKKFAVYMLASAKQGTLYIGMTSNLPQRLAQHQNEELEGFTKDYHVKRLVHFEYYPNFEQAMRREKAMKKWYRKWKIELIESHNPDWKDISNQMSFV
jgi:putative endonuclease